jgi:hypothetical protein
LRQTHSKVEKKKEKDAAVADADADIRNQKEK